MTRGTPPYHPQLLVKVLLYACAVGIPASRQIARKLEEDVALRVLAANQRPDFRTLSACAALDRRNRILLGSNGGGELGDERIFSIFRPVKVIGIP